jgi:segregation and condensation protein A
MMEKHQIKIHQFEGPLDLLLALIEGQKLDITQIALAQVTEQFLGYVKQLEQLDATILADYLSIAARLLVIKSKAILPSLEIEQEEEEFAEDLAAKLILYKQFKEVAKFLQTLDNKRKQSFTRTLTFQERITFLPDNEVTADVIYNSVLKVVRSLKELDNLPKAQIRDAISIQEKIDHLQSMLSNQIETRLSDLLATAKNKPDMIITFLALLELIKQRIFTVDQEALFTEITIKKYEQSLADPVTEEPKDDKITSSEDGDDDDEEDDDEDDDDDKD